MSKKGHRAAGKAVQVVGALPGFESLADPADAPGVSPPSVVVPDTPKVPAQGSLADEMVRLLADHTITEIAERFKTSKQNVSATLRRHGYRPEDVRRVREEAVRAAYEQRLRALHAEGRSTRAIGKVLGLSPSYVLRLLRHFGLGTAVSATCHHCGATLDSLPRTTPGGDTPDLHFCTTNPACRSAYARWRYRRDEQTRLAILDRKRQTTRALVSAQCAVCGTPLTRRIAPNRVGVAVCTAETCRAQRPKRPTTPRTRKGGRTTRRATRRATAVPANAPRLL